MWFWEILRLFRWTLRWSSSCNLVTLVVWVILRIGFSIPFEALLGVWLLTFVGLLVARIHLWAANDRVRYAEAMLLALVLYAPCVYGIMVVTTAAITLIADRIHFLIELAVPVNWWLIWTICFVSMTIALEKFLRRKLRVRELQLV